MELFFDGNAQAPAPAAADVIKDATDQTFMADVVEASMDVPVIVDFWAPWCGPCKQLTPALEKAVQGAKGKVRLVKVNVDENQQVAAQLRVQSVPTVYAFKEGRPVDGFAGGQPESQIKAFIQKLIEGGGEAGFDDALAEAKRLLDGGHHQDAGEIYRQILSEDPGNAQAIAGVLRCYLKGGETETARQFLDRLPAEMRENAEIKSVEAALELADQAGGSGEIAGLRAKVEAAPDDHQARYDLAMALYAAGQSEEAMDELLESIRRDRTWEEEKARQQLLKLFEALGPGDPLVAKARRKLSSILFS